MNKSGYFQQAGFGDIFVSSGLLVFADVHAARSPLARPKHGQFGPVQARPGPFPTVPGLGPSPQLMGWHGPARSLQAGPTAAR